MPEKESVRIEIGFDGGQIMSSMVTTDSASELEQALNKTTAKTLTLESIDGPLIVVLAHVTYVKRFPPEGRIGFIAS
jgi:hypothetical protein